MCSSKPKSPPPVPPPPAPPPDIKIETGDENDSSPIKRKRTGKKRLQIPLVKKPKSGLGIPK